MKDYGLSEIDERMPDVCHKEWELEHTSEYRYAFDASEFGQWMVCGAIVVILLVPMYILF